MKISFYLNKERKKNLYCRITDGADRVTFSLEHTIEPERWDIKNEVIEFPDIHFFTLSSLRDNLTKEYHKLKSVGKENILNILKIKAETLMDGDGLDGIDRSLFDSEYSGFNVPKYVDFIKAFEKYSGLTKKHFKVQTLDSLILFHTAEQVYEMDTYSGLIARLKDFIERKSRDEINTQTNRMIWQEIFQDGGIEKHVFMPVMLREWEIFWQEKYIQIKEELGKTNHLDESKAISWRALHVFMECFDGAGDAIKLAYEIDEMDLYPLSVFAMLEIFDQKSCFDEYCGLEFESDEWKSIRLNEGDDIEGPVFYIKLSEDI